MNDPRNDEACAWAACTDDEVYEGVWGDGSRAAAEELLARCLPLLYRAAAGQARKLQLPNSEIEDVQQEVALAFWSRLNDFCAQAGGDRPPCLVAALVHRVTWLAARDFGRRFQRGRKCGAAAADVYQAVEGAGGRVCQVIGAPHALERAANDPSCLVAAQDFWAAIVRTVDRMSGRVGQVWESRLRGCSLHELPAQLGVAAITVRRDWERICSTLRKRFGD
jgi:DNA-directed RNA polymerase specialized sigma24 family protein